MFRYAYLINDNVVLSEYLCLRDFNLTSIQGKDEMDILRKLYIQTLDNMFLEPYKTKIINFITDKYPELTI